MDPNLISALSIARRVLDPLGELIKVSLRFLITFIFYSLINIFVNVQFVRTVPKLLYNKQNMYYIFVGRPQKFRSWFIPTRHSAKNA